MKRAIATVLMVLVLASGCTMSTPYGQCVGVSDEKDPALQYDVSAWNIVMAVLFVEMIFPPIVVVLSAVECPIGRKQVK